VLKSLRVIKAAPTSANAGKRSWRVGCSRETEIRSDKEYVVSKKEG
jgi:hypothetical protein